uniref:Uncharacterized protein n=1 Tax=Octopus bimaculoides TaxID=37653 RepID=A0A0L8IB47_OCTBM
MNPLQLLPKCVGIIMGGEKVINFETFKSDSPEIFVRHKSKRSQKSFQTYSGLFSLKLRNAQTESEFWRYIDS